MKIQDRRILDKLSEDERKQYEEEILTHLADCSEKREIVDVELIMSQIPLKGRKEKSQEEPQKSDEEPA
jgi:hypothetical protein